MQGKSSAKMKYLTVLIGGRRKVKDFDQKMMRLALGVAKDAALKGEVPVGAVLVDNEGTVLAAEGNDCVSSCDPVGHAEIRVLRAAARTIQNYRLPETSLYVTLEPCCMCAAAMVHARVKRLIFGATDPKTGAIVSRYSIGSDGILNHSFSVKSGVLANECSGLLKDFFCSRR